MLNDQPLKLRQVRDFGETLSATSLFIRYHGRPMYRALAVLCLPPMLVVGFLVGQRMQSFFGTAMAMAGGGSPDGLMGELIGFYVVLFFSGLVMYAITVLAIAVVHEYIRAYHLGDHHGISTKQLWDAARKQYWSYFGASFLSGLLLVVGFMLCLLPGFFPLAVLSLVLIVHAIERTGGSMALSRSYKLVINQFWPTLGLILVLGVMMVLIYYAISLIFMIIMGGSMFAGFSETPTPDAVAQSFSGFGLMMSVQYMAQQVVQFLLYPYIWIALSLRYFSLVEEQESAGLRERVQGFEQV